MADSAVMKARIAFVLALASSAVFFFSGLCFALGNIDTATFLILVAIWLKLRHLD